MSWQCDGCDVASLDCRKAGRCVAREEFAKAGFDGRHLTDPLHPNGRCTCWGEGRCALCMQRAGANLLGYNQAPPSPMSEEEKAILREYGIDAGDQAEPQS